MDDQEPSEYELAARAAREQHSTATVSVLQSLHSMEHSVKIFTGNAFVIKLANGGCKLITCQHMVRDNLENDNFQLWVRFFGANEDVEATIQHFSVEKDIAILDVAKLPDTEVSPTELEFSKKKKVGTTGTLLGYFNPDSVNVKLQTENLIAKSPNAVPGKIIGPLVNDSIHPDENWLLSHDCYGIHGCCGSPIISYQSGKVVAMFKQSIDQIHFGIATKTIKEQLRKWVEASEEATIGEMIEEL